MQSLRTWANSQRGTIRVQCPICRAVLSFHNIDTNESGRRRRSLSTEPSQPRVASPPPPRSQTPHNHGGVTTFSQVARSVQIPVCTCGRQPGVQGRHSRHCEISRASAALQGSLPPLRRTQQEQLELPPPETTQQQQRIHNSTTNTALHPPDSAVASAVHHDSATSLQQQAVNSLHQRPAFSYSDIYSLSAKIPTLREIPLECSTIVSIAFANTLRATSSTIGSERSNAVLHALAFCVLVLHRPPPSTHRTQKLATIVRERARLWTQPNGPSTLYQRALQSVTEREAALGPRQAFEGQNPPQLEPTQEAPNVRSENPIHFGIVAHLLAGESEFQLSDEALSRADKAAAGGMYSRACRSLHATPLAPQTERVAELLRDLHPSGGLPENFSRILPEVDPISHVEILRELKRFPRGVSWGPTGTRIELIAQMATHPGANVAVELAAFTHLLVTGALSPADTLACFSARLLAGYKNMRMDSLRPIACGEIYRRLGGKIMLTRVSRQAAPHLSIHRQLAVGVQGGSEAIVHAVQKLVKVYLTQPNVHSRKVFVKGDLRNAYNICSRLKMLLAAQVHCPIIYPYLVSAYANRTDLHFGDIVISSEAGVQQGDPLATLGFTLVLAEACSRVPAPLHDNLDLEAWFADDSNIGGDIDHVVAFFNALEALGPEFGFEFRRDKFHVYCHPSLQAEAAERFSTTNVAILEEVNTLGAPAGSQAYTDLFARRLVDAAKLTFNRIAEMPNMHRSASVLAFCGRGLATHLCRSSLPNTDILRELDSAFLDTASTIYGKPLTDVVSQQLGKRYTAGGCGYRPIAPFAKVAYLASEQETSFLQSRLLKPEFMEDTMTIVLATAQLPANVEEAIRASVGTPPRRRLQKQWSLLLEPDSEATGSLFDQARINSCRGSHLSLHPIIAPGEKFEWLDNPQCSVIMSLRLGLPLYSNPGRCPLCLTSISDVYGYHALSCIHGGHRIRAHNAARNDIAKLAGKALLSPSTEAHCFPDAPSRRIDILMRGLLYDGKPAAVDYALISHTPSNVAAGATSTGGAATAYERVKQREYGGLAQRAQVHLVPMIQDVYGAWSDSAREILGHISRRMADRWGSHRGTVRNTNSRWLLSRLQKRVADILLLATPAEQQPPDPTE